MQVAHRFLPRWKTGPDYPERLSVRVERGVIAMLHQDARSAGVSMNEYVRAVLAARDVLPVDAAVSECEPLAERIKTVAAKHPEQIAA